MRERPLQASRLTLRRGDPRPFTAHFPCLISRRRPSYSAGAAQRSGVRRRAERAVSATGGPRDPQGGHAPETILALARCRAPLGRTARRTRGPSGGAGTPNSGSERRIPRTVSASRRDMSSKGRSASPCRRRLAPRESVGRRTRMGRSSSDACGPAQGSSTRRSLAASRSRPAFWSAYTASQTSRSSFWI
jgi:hypothetical protein